MKKQQLWLGAAGICIVIALFTWGKTVNPNKTTKPAEHTDNHSISIKEILTEYKKTAKPDQIQKLISLENAVVRGAVKEDQLHSFHRLAAYWRDSLNGFHPYAYYTAEAAKLENSEKSLTFAAHLFLDRLLMEDDHAMQTWLGSEAKVLFEKAIGINPSNDSSKIGLGACYIFGNIADNPMQGILKIKEVADKSPSNVYAWMMLGLGGKKSQQYDKAIERFTQVIKVDPKNLGATLNLAECFEIKGDKQTAITWYNKAAAITQGTPLASEIEKRIKQLK